MELKTVIRGITYKFKDVKEVLAKSNEEKSGDILAGVAAKSDIERIAARYVLSNLTLEEIRNHPVVPYESDEVTCLIQDGVEEDIYNTIKSWTVGEFREWILSYKATNTEIHRISKGLTSEMIAAVAKIMSNLDLIFGAAKITVTATCNTTIGEPGTLAMRLQPNHPSDDLDGITASLLEGLSYGIGDAVIGLNPVNDTKGSLSQVLSRFDEVKNEFDIPTQICVLGHIATQIEAIKNGANTDLVFQSIAGSEKGNRAFGFETSMILEARQMLLEAGRVKGENVLYFETGQGSELSSDSHYAADQVTMEARCYGYAKQFSPYLVNTVVGFIGPEYLYDSKQVTRAGLEDHFMGKLTGLPMGCDCCYTNHMLADQNDIENLAVLLANAGCNYFIGVPMGDDVMLNYQCLSYHDGASIRELLKLHPIYEFEKWCERMGILENGKLTSKAGDPTLFMKRK